MSCPQCPHCHPTPKLKYILLTQRWFTDYGECNWEVKPMSTPEEAWASLERRVDQLEKEHRSKIVDIGLPHTEYYYGGGIVSYRITMIDN